ncbi:MAG: c-type cytochrome [Beijerinckiaceae bacterium]
MRILALAAALTAAPALASGDKELGKHLSSECVSCHQLTGRVVAGVPAIVGIDQESFKAMMESYRKKERPNQVMQSIAAKFNDEEIAALAAFFESVRKK